MAKLVMFLARQGTVVDKQCIYQNLYILINPLQGHTVHMFGDSLNIKNTLYKCSFWNVSNQWCWKAAHNPCQYTTTSFHMWTYKPWHVSSLLTFHKGYWGYCIYIYICTYINRLEIHLHFIVSVKVFIFKAFISNTQTPTYWAGFQMCWLTIGRNLKMVGCNTRHDQRISKEPTGPTSKG